MLRKISFLQLFFSMSMRCFQIKALKAMGSRKIPPGGISIQIIPTHQTFFWKFPPGKFPPRIFSPGMLSPISLIAFLHLTLRFEKLSQT